MTILVSYLYPSCAQYVDDYITSLERQTYKNFQVVIFNDGVSNAYDLFEKSKLKFKLIDLSGSPLQIRYKSFSYLKSLDLSYIIFQDLDDLLTSNRISHALDLLEDFDLVCNDLSLMDESSRLFKENVWEARLGGFFEFDYPFIWNKNIVGLGNTAIRKSVLDSELAKDPIPIAADWFIFFQLLYKKNLKAVFTSGAQTLYRQHSNNLVGLSEVSSSRIKQALKVKINHFKALINSGIDAKKYYLEAL
ncbi:MAG: glycosyltransferase, partial [Ekhidna sp.]